MKRIRISGGRPPRSTSPKASPKAMGEKQFDIKRKRKSGGSATSKEQRLDSDESTASRKVGIVCCSIADEETEEGVSEEYQVIEVYGVQMHDSESCVAVEDLDVLFSFTHPGASPVATCVWGSVLYMFWGSKKFDRFEPRKRPKKFDLSKAKRDGEVKEKDLGNVRDMRNPKILPRAVPTPDGKKIIVFGTITYIDESHTAFELYDPKEDSWEEAPGLPWGRYCNCTHKYYSTAQCSCSTKVGSYWFVKDTHFIVKMIRGKITFSLNLKTKEWSCIYVPDVPWDADYVVTAKNRYVLTPGGTFKFSDGGGFRVGGGVDRSFRGEDRSFVPGPDFPLGDGRFRARGGKDRSPDRDGLFLWAFRPSIIRLPPFRDDEQAKVCYTCILRPDDEGFKSILLDVCRTELPSLTTQVTNSVRVKFSAPIPVLVMEAFLVSL